MGRVSRADPADQEEPGNRRREQESGILRHQGSSKCSSYGKPEQHKGCRCNEAADEKKTIAVTYKGPFGKDAYGYWIPLPEQPEYILHFSVGITMEYEEAKNVTVTKDVLGK